MRTSTKACGYGFAASLAIAISLVAAGAIDLTLELAADGQELTLELVDAGSRWLHVVDLDGARDGRPVQAELVESIIDAVGDTARVEVGGGIRDLTTAAHYLETGAARVVLGTAAIHGELAGKNQLRGLLL